MITHAIQMTVLMIFWFRKRKFEKQSSFDLRMDFFFRKRNLLRPVKTSPFKRTNNGYYRKLARPFTVKKKRIYQIVF